MIWYSSWTKNNQKLLRIETFSYKPANDYAKALCMDIKAAMNEYKLNANNTTATATVVQAAPSSAEELKKFKELLDMGIITQEEFDANKKQLLGP